MLLFGRRPRRDPRTDLHRRRLAPHQKRTRSWLRLAFWFRGNRRVSRKDVGPRGTVVGLQEGAALETGRTATDTQPHSGTPAPPKMRPRWLYTLLRLAGAMMLALLLCASGYAVRHLVRHSRSFAVRVVRISPTLHVPQDRLLQRAGVQLGDNLFHLDLGRMQKNLMAEPWLKSVRVRRELPGTVVIDITEYQPQAVVALNSLYLADAEGQVFKRATPAETAVLPVITGIGREAYLSDRAESQSLIREGLLALDLYRPVPGRRPPIGEVHVDRFAGIILYTKSGMAIRLGRGERADLLSRLRRFDAVWSALQKQERQAQVVFLDNRAHPDHVTVRLEEGKD